MQYIDGLHRSSPTITQPAEPTDSAPSVRRSRRWVWAVCFVILLIVLPIVTVTVWAQPIFAALPFRSWADRGNLARLMRPGTYLVLFQNPRELRPTGGFIGSFATVETGWGGQIKKIDVETNIYTRDQTYAGRLNVEPPAPMREFLGDSPWALRDSNWAIDFPEAAQQIAWFYAQEGGTAVDGVIALDARVLERILAITGPVTLPGTATLVTADTVIDTLQEEIEKNYWKDPKNRLENKPKTVIAQLLPMLMTQLRAMPIQTLLETASSAFAEKELMVFMRDPSLAQTFSESNWDGRLATTDQDYLYINEANLTPVDGRERVIGAKSSWNVLRSVDIARTQEPGQTILHTVRLYRAHQGTSTWPDGPNHSFMRIAVPAGANFVRASRNLQSISGEVRLSTEANKTVFGVWSKLSPGQSEVIELTYTTISKESNMPELIIDRQPGVPAFPVSLSDDTLPTRSADLVQRLLF